MRIAVAADAGHQPDFREARSDEVGRLLAELEALLLRISPEACHCWPESAKAIVARHVDRCLDLLETFLSAPAAGAIVYGFRQRTCAAGTLAANLERVRALQALSPGRAACSLDRVIRVVHEAWPLDPGERVWSTLGNELAFVVNAVVDSQKAIERVMTSMGFTVPPEFGSMELRPLRARSLVLSA